MDYTKRLDTAFGNALVLPFNSKSRFIIMSDCHRGTGTHFDNFLKNQNLYFAALQHYYENDYQYIELGDGDELWENRSLSQIIEIHDNVFWLLSKFYQENRFYMIYGNHDMCKRSAYYRNKNCTYYYNHRNRCYVPLFPEMNVYESIILKNTSNQNSIYLTHGHQVDFFNSTLWRLSKFLVRYVWRPLENAGFLDPTSAAKNYTKKQKIEKRLSNYAEEKQQILITGHTHRPMCPTKNEPPYFNSGSSVHPRCITGIEIEGDTLTLVKWTYHTREDYTLCVGRDVLARYPD